MYNNVGLRTARGSGTNSYVQRNLASVKNVRAHALSYEEQRKREATAERKVVHRVANKEILEHEEKRKVEAELVEWAESEGILDAARTEEIEQRMREKREEIAASRRSRGDEEGRLISTHRELELKEEKQRRFGRAIGVEPEYVEGSGLDPNYRRRKREANRNAEYSPAEAERLKREEQKILMRLEELRRSSTEATKSGALARSEDRQSSYSSDHRHGSGERRRADAPCDREEDAMRDDRHHQLGYGSGRHSSERMRDIMPPRGRSPRRPTHYYSHNGRRSASPSPVRPKERLNSSSPSASQIAYPRGQDILGGLSRSLLRADAKGIDHDRRSVDRPRRSPSPRHHDHRSSSRPYKRSRSSSPSSSPSTSSSSSDNDNRRSKKQKY